MVHAWAISGFTWVFLLGLWEYMNMRCSWQLELESERLIFGSGKFSRLLCHYYNQETSISTHPLSTFEATIRGPCVWAYLIALRTSIYELGESWPAMRPAQFCSASSTLPVGICSHRQSTWQPASLERYICPLLGERGGREWGTKKQEAVMALVGKNMPQVDCWEGCLSVLFGWWCIIFFLGKADEKLLWSSCWENVTLNAFCWGKGQQNIV